MSIRKLLATLAVGAVAVSLISATPATAQSPASVAAGFQPLALFDDYITGSLRAQGPWSVNTPGAADGAFAHADVPAVFSGKALAMLHGGENPAVQYRGNAYAALGALSLPAASTGTVFFELLAADAAKTRLNVGLSADASPGLGADTTGDPLDLNDFGPQLTLDERGLVVRDGITDVVVDATVASNEIIRVWLTVDNAGDTYTVHTAAPGQPAALLSASDGQSTFAFRTAGTDPLVTLLLLNDPDDLPTASTYLDSFFVSPSAASTLDPAPSYSTVHSFDTLNTGALNGQNGWTGSTGATIAADPVDPTNKALRISGANTTARHTLDAINSAETGTLFLRVRRSGLVDTSFGLTDVTTATTFTNFRAQVTSPNSTALNVRPPAGAQTVGTLGDNVWQCVWVVADNASDSYSVYSRGGEYVSTTRLPTDQIASYGFRSSVAGALNTFLLLQGANSAGTEWIDDVAIDPTSVNLRVPSGDASDCQTAVGADLPVVNPVPRTPLPSSVTWKLSEVTTIPASAAGAPEARINYLSEVPGSTDIYAVPDLNGRAWLVQNGTPKLFLDVAAQFPDFVYSPSLGTGLGFIAFHPDYAQNGLFYTVHTEAGAALTTKTPSLPSPSTTTVHGIITEWHATNPSATTFAGTKREILRIGFTKFLHGMQQLGFNPTAAPGSADYGKLYISVGDGDENPNFSANPQDKGKPQGKLLRIDPLGSNGAGGAYGIPSDNPFVGEAGSLGEVWAYGFRNPHRFSWDKADGRMFVGNIGEKTIDAVYQVAKGDNAGWNEREGSFVFKKTETDHVYALPADDDEYGYDYPVLDIGRNTGISLVSGFAYRGATHPQFDGAYFFGDIVSGEIRYTSASALRKDEVQPMFYKVNLLGPDGTAKTMRELAGNSRVDLRFGTDSEGEIYILSKANGKIWKVTEITGAPDRPSCAPDDVTVNDVNAGTNWQPLTPSLWEFPGDQIILKTAGTQPEGPRRPFEYATLQAGPEVGSLRYDVEVRLDEATSASNRDIVLIWNYQSPTKFYYAHISQDNTIYPHNGIFVVDGQDRLRIDDQWNGTVGAPKSIDDKEWHDVRLDYCADTGEVAVYIDNAEIPLMTATNTAFVGGRVGFGSFDNFGRARNVSVTADLVAPPEPEIQVTATATTRCVAGKVTLVTQIGNTDDVPLNVSVATAYGTKSINQIAPGNTVAQTFSTRAPQVGAGTATVTARTAGGDERVITADYAARSCS